MPRRIEIELTSARPDGTWTWRAAGAREPKGVLPGDLLYDGAKAGDVVKAEAEFELEGIVITSVTPPRTDSRRQSERIEVIGPGRSDTPGVTTQLVGRGERRGRRDGGEDRRRDRGPGRTGEGRGRGDLGRPRREGAPAGGGPEREGRPRRDSEARRPGSHERQEGGSRQGGAREGRAREGRADRDTAAARPRRGEGERRPGGPGRTSSQSERGDRGRTRRLNPGSTHRKAAMESLPPEHQAIAEQLLRGGIPAVRTALHLERERAEAEGRPAPNTEALLALAESLLPSLRAAEWRDRAEAAAAALDEISMRDLRSVVAGADLARDEESRALATKLREAVDARVAKLHSDWTADITGQLDAGRVVRAVRLSSRPPDAGSRLDSELAGRLAQAAGAALSPETPADLWAALLEAVAESPIRRSVTPVGLPESAPPDLKRAAHQYSGSIPALAKLLGVTIPPPPAPSRRRPPDRPPGPRRHREGQPAAPAGGSHPETGPAEDTPAPAGGSHPETGPAQPAEDAPGAPGEVAATSEPAAAESAATKPATEPAAGTPSTGAGVAGEAPDAALPGEAEAGQAADRSAPAAAQAEAIQAPDDQAGSDPVS